MENPSGSGQVVLTPEETEHKKDASTSMVLGIIGDVFVWYPLIGIAGLVLSVIALIKSNRNHEFAISNGIKESGMNIAGKWCGIAGIVIGSILFVLYLTVFVVLILFAIGIIQNSGFFNTIFQN